MKPIVLQAQIKELSQYLKDNPELNQAQLLEIQKKIIKMHQEIIEQIEKL